MILFLNFAPLEYLGGAERKTLELFSEIRKKERVVALTASQSIAEAYGKLVINQPFENRSKGELLVSPSERIHITVNSFLPFSKEWKTIVHYIQESRIIYCKCDFNELILLLYFGGLSVFSKTVASVRSPWCYEDPVSFMDRFHNIVYRSWCLGFLLKRLKKIHVLNHRDKKILVTFFGIHNTIVIPNYTYEVPPMDYHNRNNKQFDVVFIGELLVRKGVDIVINIIRQAPKDYVFHIIGDGPMRKDIELLGKKFSNCVYHGYLKTEKVNNVLGESDVLLFPSRAEGFGAVILEALSRGIPTVTSRYVATDIPEPFQYLSDNSPESYLQLLEKIRTNKKLHKNQIREYSKKFLYQNVMPEMEKLVWY